MSIIAQEKFGRKFGVGPESRYESVWHALENDPANPPLSDPVAAHAAIYAAVPLTFQGMWLQDIEVSEQAASGIFYGVATYGMWKIPEHGDTELQISHRLDTERRYHGLIPSVVYAKPGRTAPDNEQLVGQNPDGQPEGMDCSVPVATYSLTCYFNATSFTQPFIDGLTAIRGCVNDATFGFVWKGLTFTFFAGECLFAGFSLGTRGTELWQITYDFEGRANRTLSVGPITGIALAGHDHLHVLWEPHVDPTSTHLTSGPLAVYIDRKYPRASFSSVFP
jgi:hypothetical protein